MSWIDQGRQEHGWFGHGTAPGVDAGELEARAFAVAHLAADDFLSKDKLPFPLEKTAQVLRTFAPVMASEAGSAPNAFRLRFFRGSFDSVDAWTIQLTMRDIAAADTHAGLVQAGRDLAAKIRAHGPEGWTQLLENAVAQRAPAIAQRAPVIAQTAPAVTQSAPAPPPEPANGDAEVQNAQFAAPLGPVPLILPPQFIPGTPENRELTDATIKLLREVGSLLSRILESWRHNPDEDDEDENGRRRRPRVQPKPSKPDGAADREGETRDKPPPNSKPISETPWSGDHDGIKKGIGARSTDDVRISPDGDAWVKNQDGTWTNRGPVSDHPGSGKPSGRTGTERNRRPSS